MHECIIYISMILMHACIYDAANFVTNERTNEQGDSRSRMMAEMMIMVVMMVILTMMMKITNFRDYHLVKNGQKIGASLSISSTFAFSSILSNLKFLVDFVL